MKPAAALVLAASILFSSVPASARADAVQLSGPIAFSSFRHGRLDIFTMEADGTGLRNLTRDPAPDFHPAWSPDGDVIAFVSLQTDLSHFDQIFTIDPVSGERRQLTDVDGGNPQAPAWSPDGSRIAFHEVYGGALDAELFVMDADDTDVVQLTDNATDDSDAAWSPDGSRIAFVRNGRLETMDPAGNGVEPLTPEGMLAFDPAWSPDGERLAFVGRKPDAAQEDLFTIAPDGTAMRRVTHTLKSESAPSWSPTGWLARLRAHPTPSRERRRVRLDTEGEARWNGPRTPDVRWVSAGFVPGLARLVPDRVVALVLAHTVAERSPCALDDVEALVRGLLGDTLGLRGDRPRGAAGAEPLLPALRALDDARVVLAHLGRELVTDRDAERDQDQVPKLHVGPPGVVGAQPIAMPEGVWAHC